MERDSMGELALVQHSTVSPTISQPSRLFGEADALKCLARLAANYGAERISDDRQRAMLAFEWAEAFAFKQPAAVHDAIARHINTPKSGDFWPKISQIKAIISENAPPPTRPAYRAERVEFCREGRTIAEEVEWRGQVIAQAWARHGRQAGITLHQEATSDEHMPKPASQDMTISPQLRALATKRGYYRETKEPGHL